MVNLGEAVNDFLIYLDGLRRAKNTIKSYNFDLKDFINFVVEHKNTLEIEDLTLKRLTLSYLDSLKFYNNKKNKNEYAISSLNRKRSCIRKFSKFLYIREYTTENVEKQIETIKNNKKASIDILDTEEISEVYTYFNNLIKNSPTPIKEYKAIRNKFIFNTLIYTALRVSELTSLKWTNIDLVKNNIFVEEGKGNKQRIIPINPEYKTDIQNYKDYLTNFHKNDNSIFKGYVFPRNERNTNINITTKTIRCIVKDTVHEAGIKGKHISPHSLRHTFASHSLLNNMSIPSLANILGHSQNSITLNIYSHVINEEQKQTEMSKLSYRTL